MELQNNPQLMPRHIAIIMDGNGRWAEQRGKPRMWGHHQGAKNVRHITEECSRLGIGQLTLYAFSYENWRRPDEEVGYLMTLLRRFLVQEREVIMKNNIRLQAIGRLDRLPRSVAKELEYMQNLSAGNSGMVLCLALSYSGRAEIVDAVRTIAAKVSAGEIVADQIDDELFQQHLYQPDMPDPDLLIRTGGDMRISNFLLWQISYTELWMTSVLWPDFEIMHLQQAIQDFRQRERRFGKVIPKIPLTHAMV